ncbi:MAG: hypothetical protein QM770_15020 [Tepidisphaeraceae bacterium]
MPKPRQVLPDEPSLTETDPRFPTGKWTGFWLQKGMPGRQVMALDIRFVNGRVKGTGHDLIGDFDFSGSYDLTDGSVLVVKQYLGAHKVTYEGRNEGDGQWIWGLWTIGSRDRGGFHLWPASEDDPTQRSLRCAKSGPREASRQHDVAFADPE